MKRIVAGGHPLTGAPAGEAVGPDGVGPVAEVGLLGPAPLIGIAFFVLWVTIGLLTAVVLSRWGHDLRSTGALGLVFGPLFIPLAVHLRRGQSEMEPVLVAPGRAGPGLDVLVSLQCPPAGAASVLPVLHLLGNRLGRLTLVRVLDFESMRDERERAQAELELSCAALFLAEYEPSLLLLAGHPRRALQDYAAHAGPDAVFVVGGSRRSRSQRRPGRCGAPSPEPPVLVVADVARRERRA